MPKPARAMIAALPTFWKHLLTVLGGSLAAQALPIAAAPFITRLCTPAELGAFSVWFGVVAIAAVAATLRLENAMVVDHARSRQRLGFDVVAWSAGWLAVLITAALATARLLGWTHMPWAGILTSGVAAWLTATMQTTLAYAASHNAFAPAARARIVAAGGVAGSQLALLALVAWMLPQQAGGGTLALLAGQLLGLGVGLYAALRWLQLPLRAAPGMRAPASRAVQPVPLSVSVPVPVPMPVSVPVPVPLPVPASMPGLRASALALARLVRLLRLARRLMRRGPRALLPNAAQRRYLHRHRALWHFTLPSNLLNAAVGQLPLLIIGARHGAMAAGLFALTQRVLAAPISLLAASVLEVFKRESVRQYQELGNCRRAYVHALRVLLALGIAPTLLLWIAAPALFGFAFGADWRGAGEMAQMLAPLFFLNFVASPLSYVFFVAGRQKIELLWQMALFVVTLLAFAAPLTLAHNVLAYTIGYSLLYLVYLQLSYRYALNRPAGRRLHVAG